jgi:hypothetical protein
MNSHVINRSTKPDATRKVLAFGDLITAVYENCGKASANGLLRFAINTHLVEFEGADRFLIVREPHRDTPRLGP